MFTVIIPLYNKEKYIQRTLESVLSQSFEEFEVIVVNDGSTDDSIKIITQMKDDRIKIINQKNQGVSEARNTGIKNAEYEMIALLDADDTWDSKFLETLYRLIKEFPEAGLYYSNYKFVNGEDQKIEELEDEIKGNLVEDYFAFSKKNIPICASSVVIPKNVFVELGGFPKEFSRGEDLYLWTLIALRYQIVYTNYIGGFYYRNIPDSLTRKKQILEKSFASVAEELYFKYREFAYDEKSFKAYMYPIILSKSKYLIEDNKTKEARKIIRKYFGFNGNRKKPILLYMFSYFPYSIRRFW